MLLTLNTKLTKKNQFLKAFSTSAYNIYNFTNKTNINRLPIADSAATDTVIRESDTHLLSGSVHNTIPFTIGFPNGTTATSTNVASLAIAQNIQSIPAHIFKDTDIDESLILLADYCNRGCDVQLTSTDIHITHEGNTVAYGVK